MKRLGTLALAVILVTGCNAMKPKMEETEALSQWTVERYTAQATAIQQRGTWREILEDTDVPEIATAAIPAPTPMTEQVTTSQQEAETQEAAWEQKDRTPQKTPETATRAASGQQAEPTPAPKKIAQESPCQSEQDEPQLEEQPEETPVMISWPYPQITCPPEPASTPEPEPTEQLQEEPTVPAPEATEQPAEPNPTPAPMPPVMPEPTPTPTGGYAVCSCGAALTPEEVLSHMKAHAMNGESHSYRAY